jgi:hypothetical protein
LAGVFQKRHHTTLDVPSGSFSFLGEPGGEVQVLMDVLRAALIRDPGLKRAYLTRIRHNGDEKIRVALCIDTETSPQEAIRPLSEHCAQYVSSIDIMFFSDLAQHHIDQLKSVAEPFCETSGA